MSVEITSSNYNGQTCNVTLYASTGNTIPYTNATQINLGTKTIPFTYSSTTNSNEYGIFSCQFSGINKTCAVSQLTPPDGDGNQYKTIKIGNQVWMSENLKTKSFLDGTPLDNVSQLTNSEWASADASQNKCWAYVDGDPNTISTFGLLYNQYAVTGSTSTANDNENLCPQGWRVPTDNDFFQLSLNLGAFAAAKLKSTTLWVDNFGTNISGFNGVPSDSRFLDGEYYDYRLYGQYWTTDESVYWYLYAYQNYTFYKSNDATGIGMCIRCIKN